MEAKVQAKVTVEAEVKPSGWSRSWSWSGSWSGNRGILGNSAQGPQNPPFGPKWHFWLRLALISYLWSQFWSHFQNWKMFPSAPATRYTITVSNRGFSLKVHFQRTLDPESAWLPPPFSSISFLLTAHARNAPPSTVEAVRVVRAGLGGEVWAVRSGR